MQKLHSETMATFREAFPSRPRRLLALAGIWVAVVILSSFHWELFYFGSNPYTWWQLLRGKAALWAVWGAVTPVILWLAYRFRVRQGVIIRNGIILTLASVAFTAVYMWLYAAILWANAADVPAIQKGTVTGFFGWAIGVHSSWYFLAFWATVGIENAFLYYRGYRERELRASQLEAELANAQLSVLRSQLHPHFLFNTLHSILALVQKQDNETAIQMLTALSDLLRHALAHANRGEVALRQEIEFLRRYIGIEQVRFSDRLKVYWEVEEETLDCRVPAFLLQPLAENAIRHGIEKIPGPGRIDIRAQRDDGFVCLEIADNGVGIRDETDHEPDHGYGVSGLRARLQAMYPGHHTLSFEAREEGGTRVRLELPWVSEKSTPEAPRE